MHRIDGPGATVDNKFTDGDPVGGIQATIVTDDWLNDVQEELMSVLTAGAVVPVKGTQNQLLKAIRSLGMGVVGASRNAKMSITSANASATFTADELIVESAIGGQAYRLSSISKTINLATVGVGAMDTGLAPASGYVSVYVIFNPLLPLSSTNPAMLAMDATSSAHPEVYGGANMPAGYTASALVAVLRTTAARLFDRQILIDRFVHYNSVIFTGTNGTMTAVSASAAVPLNAKTIRVLVAITASSAAGQLSAAICTTNGGLGFPGFSQITGIASAGGQNVTGAFHEIPIVAQQIFVATSTTSTTSAGFNSYGYTF